MSGIAVGVAAFLAMEAVTYATHRWVMHGVGMRWHRSHHLPPKGRFERNDLFPVVFASVGIVLFAAGVWPVAIGMTAYGAAYLAVHDVAIHRRLPVGSARGRYLRWLRDAHGDHHATSREPYGMLLPLVRSSTRTARARL